jgi:hypothetical protein
MLYHPLGIWLHPANLLQWQWPANQCYEHASGDLLSLVEMKENEQCAN